VLGAGWLAIAHVSELAEPGSFLALDLLGEPLLVVRDRSGQVRVLSRVCAHRAMDIMPEGFDYPRKGSINLISCPYHRWTYDLDGSLRGCAHMQRAEGFDRADWRLAQIRSEVWHGFVFVNLDGKAGPLAEQYADFSRLIAPWRTEDMETVIGLEWDCRFNWKVMVENWLESYHHIGAHSTTLNPIMPGENTWTEPEHPHFIHAHLPFTQQLMQAMARANETGGAQPGFRPVEGLSLTDQTEWGLYVGYPIFMFLTMADRVFWYRLLPVSAQHCRLETVTLVARENRSDANFASLVESETKMLSDFHTEDMVVNIAVQRGLNSSKAVRGRLSHLEEPIWLLQRYLAARARGGYPAKADRAPYSGPHSESLSGASAGV
jgi:phenylpropionate dioxygenase-like ring-hydroxylating dioxygenase large terminal subunit